MTAAPVLLMLRFSPGQPGAFFEFHSLAELCDGLCEQYEKGLKLCVSSNSNSRTSSILDANRQISYGLPQLTEYLEAMDSVRVLLRRPNSEWVEYDKEWLKKVLFSHLKQQVLNNTTIG